MPAGFVYIVLNPSFPQLVKIGRTTGPVKKRAQRLSSSTGVPTPYIVIYDEYVDDCEAVEQALHQRFDAHRVREKREFFSVPVREAVRALVSEAVSGRFPPAPNAPDEYEILPELRKHHGSRLKPDLISVKIVNWPSVVYLECTSKAGIIADEIVERMDLSFIDEDEDIPLCPPSNGARVNAFRFLKLDPYSLINVTNLYTSEAEDEVALQHKSLCSTS